MMVCMSYLKCIMHYKIPCLKQYNATPKTSMAPKSIKVNSNVNANQQHDNHDHHRVDHDDHHDHDDDDDHYEAR